jgi:WD40 repeat protein
MVHWVAAMLVAIVVLAQAPLTWTAPSKMEEDGAATAWQGLVGELERGTLSGGAAFRAVASFRCTHPGSRSAQISAEKLRLLPSPLDALKAPPQLGGKLPREAVAVLDGHDRAIAALAFSPDCVTLASTGWDNRLRLWKLDGARPSQWATLAGSPSAVAFAPDGKSLAAGGPDDRVHVWSVGHPKPKLKESLAGHAYRPFVLAYAPNGKLLVSGCFDPPMRFWDLRSDDPDGWSVLASQDSGAYHVGSLSISADGTLLATGSALGSHLLRIWRLEGVLLAELELPKTRAQIVEFAPAGMVLATYDDSMVTLWDTSAPKPRQLQRVKTGADRVNALAFSLDGKALAVAGKTGTVTLWDVTSGKKVQEIAVSVEVKSLAFAPDCRHLAVGFGDGAICVLRVGQ